MALNHNIFDFSLRLFLFLSPIFCFRDFVPSVARGKFFIFGTVALFGLSLFNGQKRKFNQPLVGSFLLLAFLRMFFDNGADVFESYNFWVSSSSFMYVFSGVILFYVVYCHTENIRSLFNSIIAVSVLNCVLVSCQFIGLDFMWHNTQAISGFMDTVSQLGQYSAMSLPILFYSNPFLALIPLFTLFASKSISPILASAFGMALLGGFKGKILKIKIGIGILLVILGLLNFGYIQAKFYCRPIQWQKTLRVALQRPYMGWGYNSFKDKVAQIKAKDSIGGNEFRRAHNDYLHTAQEMGFPIVIVFGIFIIGLIKKFIMKKDKDKLTIALFSSVIIVLINMAGQTEIRYASIAGTFIVLLGLLCIKLEVQNS